MENKFLEKVPDTWVAPIAFLLLFIVSATITSSLVLGKPALLYFDGKKHEAITLFLYTLSFLFVITVVVFISLIVFY